MSLVNRLRIGGVTNRVACTIHNWRKVSSMKRRNLSAYFIAHYMMGYAELTDAERR